MAIVLQPAKIERYLRDIVDHIILNEGSLYLYYSKKGVIFKFSRRVETTLFYGISAIILTEEVRGNEEKE